MTTPFTSDPDAVAERWRPLTDAESSVATAKLDDARVMLLAMVPSIPARVADQTLDGALVVQVQVEMVLRVLKNPGGVRQQTLSVDDATRSWTLDNAISAGSLYVTDSELALLSPPARSPRIGSVRLGTWHR